jgi:hypothetical protein
MSFVSSNQFKIDGKLVNFNGFQSTIKRIQMHLNPLKTIKSLHLSKEIVTLIIC